MAKSMTILIFCIFVTTSYSKASLTHTAREDINAWNNYVNKHELEFTKEEYWARFKIFTENLRYIENRNSEGLSFTLGITKFSHMTKKEYKRFLKSSGPKNYPDMRVYQKFSSDVEIEDIDYRELGMVTPIKDQGKCGSGWAFSAVGYLESQNLLEKKPLKTFSEQQLVDCSASYGNRMCSGGQIYNAFFYIRDHGLMNDTVYKYTARNDSCKAEVKQAELFVDKFYFVPQANEKALQTAITLYGPISVSIDASDDDFQFYSGGIYNSDTCSSNYLDHSVLVVGIGSTPMPHYIVKNSWGKNWGDEGYIYMSRDKDNQCGIATEALYAMIRYPK